MDINKIKEAIQELEGEIDTAWKVQELVPEYVREVRETIKALQNILTYFHGTKKVE